MPALLVLTVALGFTLAPWGPLARPAGQATDPPIATPTTTPLPDWRPDRCEPNDVPARPCVLTLDRVAGPFTFLPTGDQDWYSVDLGATPGLPLTISVRGTSGLDLLTTIQPAGTDTVLARWSSPTISATLAADLVGWLLIRVENRAPAPAVGQSYTIELRRTPPSPPPTVTPDPAAPAPDGLENNWDIPHAAPIGVGVIYDLSFVCPIAGGCGGGDHDYLALPVKRGTTYALLTFDLGPGVDTVVELFWGDAQTPVAGNDDAAPGQSFLSHLVWTAPADGIAIVRIGPRTGGLQPVVAIFWG